MQTPKRFQRATFWKEPNRMLPWLFSDLAPWRAAHQGRRLGTRWKGGGGGSSVMDTGAPRGIASERAVKGGPGAPGALDPLPDLPSPQAFSQPPAPPFNHHYFLFYHCFWGGKVPRVMAPFHLTGARRVSAFTHSPRPPSGELQSPRQGLCCLEHRAWHPIPGRSAELG